MDTWRKFKQLEDMSAAAGNQTASLAFLVDSDPMLLAAYRIIGMEQVGHQSNRSLNTGR
jgi:hypothetical protein